MKVPTIKIEITATEPQLLRISAGMDRVLCEHLTCVTNRTDAEGQTRASTLQEQDDFAYLQMLVTAIKQEVKQKVLAHV